MRVLTRLCMTLPVLLLAACAATGPRFESEAAPPEGRATVYIYREAGFVGSGVVYTVSANGVEIAALPAGGYFVYHAAPGEVEFSAKTEAKTSVTIDAKAGEAYYIKGTIGVGFFVGHPHLTVVPNDVGAKEIAQCNLVPGANTEGAKGPGVMVEKQGPFETVGVKIAPAEIVGTVAVPASADFDVVDQRAKVVMERTTIGHTAMSGVVFDPNEIELIRAVVGSELSIVRGTTGPARQVTCLVNEFSVTTPATALYWDATVDIVLTLQAGSQQREIKAHGVKRTYTWPSDSVIKDAAVTALKTIAKDSGQALREIVPATAEVSH
ncbi:MAG: DUF2846 domain-containing protein [Steroidobacteraceae bacterium]